MSLEHRNGRTCAPCASIMSTNNMFCSINNCLHIFRVPHFSWHLKCCSPKPWTMIVGIPFRCKNAKLEANSFSCAKEILNFLSINFLIYLQLIRYHFPTFWLALKFEVKGKRKRGRPRKIWRSQVEKESKKVGLKKEDRCQKSIKMESGSGRDCWQSTGVNPATLIYKDKTGSKLDWWWWWWNQIEN